ncbi:hypothetical protein SLS54_007610 [Diplodia seriata]
MPTHKEWKGDDLIKREQLVEFLFSDDVLGPDNAENDPMAIEHRWRRPHQENGVISSPGHDSLFDPAPIVIASYWATATLPSRAVSCGDRYGTAMPSREGGYLESH